MNNECYRIMCKYSGAAAVVVSSPLIQAVMMKQTDTMPTETVCSVNSAQLTGDLQ
jgi:hypothetical protein